MQETPLNRILNKLCENNPSFKVFYFPDESLDDNDVIKISRALTTNTSITEINIDEDNIGTRGFIALSNAIALNKNITRIKIEDNPIGHADAKALAHALRENKNIEYLKIVCSDIDDTSATILAKALALNSSLTKLNFSSNAIGNAGFASLVEATIKDSSNKLNRIELPRNHIQDAGLIELSKALTLNTSLTKVRLSYNDIKGSGLVQLISALKINYTLVGFERTYNTTEFSLEDGKNCLHVSDLLRLNKSGAKACYNEELLTLMTIWGNNLNCISGLPIDLMLNIFIILKSSIPFFAAKEHKARNSKYYKQALCKVLYQPFKLEQGDYELADQFREKVANFERIRNDHISANR